MDRKLFAIRKWGSPATPRDQRCDSARCIFPSPILRVDPTGHGIVVMWGWIDVQAVTVPTGLRIKILPTVSLVPISSN